MGASKIARDITERKRMERDAVRLAAIVDSSDDAIVGKDLAGIIETWNIGAERMFGFSAEEAIGQSIAIIIPPDRMEEEARVMTRIQTGERIPHFETLRRRKDGKLVEVSVSVSPILAKNGKVIGASKIARDITEQNRLRHAAAAASRAKDQFLATLSHELRTPLNAVTGYAQMLQKGTIPERDLARAFDVIGRNAEALTRLVNDVLDASRIATGKLRLELQPCDLGKVAEEAIAAILPASRGKSIIVTSEIEHGLVVNGDPDRLQQVLWNLLSNAVKFTPDGGSVRVTTGLEGRTARLIVEDTGIGIAPESLPHVSRRFWQADPSHMRLHGGLGLGLALAREFVELHGGRLDVSSEGLGLGARFVVNLPVAPVAAAVSSQSSSRRRRNALPITETELNVIAALAIIGLRRMPNDRVEQTGRDGYSHHVVNEGKKQVLADVAHRGAAQTPAPVTMPRRSPLTSVTPAVSMATSVPVPIAMPTWPARARAHR